MEFRFLLVSVSSLVLGCSDNREVDTDKHFVNRAEESGIHFNNQLDYTEELNPYGQDF